MKFHILKIPRLKIFVVFKNRLHEQKVTLFQLFFSNILTKLTLQITLKTVRIVRLCNAYNYSYFMNFNFAQHVILGGMLLLTNEFIHFSVNNSNG